MATIEERVSDLERKVDVLENERTHTREALDVLSGRITGIVDKKLTPMQKQIGEIHTTVQGSKGFIAGVFLTVSVVWGVIATFGLVVWNAFKQGGQS